MTYYEFMKEVDNAHTPLFFLTCDDSHEDYLRWLRKLYNKQIQPRQAARILERAYSMFIESSKYLYV